MSTVILVGYAVAVVLLTVCIFRRPRRPALDARTAAARQRVGLAPQAVEDQALVRNLEAELKDYAAMVADYYDTTGGNRT